MERKIASTIFWCIQENSLTPTTSMWVIFEFKVTGLLHTPYQVRLPLVENVAINLENDEYEKLIQVELEKQGFVLLTTGAEQGVEPVEDACRYLKLSPKEFFEIKHG